MHEVQLNWVAIMVAAFASFVGGAIWYSPVLFARRWATLIGMTEEQREGAGPAVALVLQAFVTVITAAIVAVVVSWSGADNPLEGAGVGALLGAGLIAVDHAKLLVFERRPLALFAINNGYTVLSLVAIGALEAVWRA
jgi:hypothetical protein